MKLKVHKKHWYKQYVGFCPLCMRDAGYKVRIYGRRPKRYRNRIEYLPDNITYCGCMF